MLKLSRKQSRILPRIQCKYGVSCEFLKANIANIERFLLYAITPRIILKRVARRRSQRVYIKYNHLRRFLWDPRQTKYIKSRKRSVKQWSRRLVLFVRRTRGVHEHVEEWRQSMLHSASPIIVATTSAENGNIAINGQFNNANDDERTSVDFNIPTAQLRPPLDDVTKKLKEQLELLRSGKRIVQLIQDGITPQTTPKGNDTNDTALHEASQSIEQTFETPSKRVNDASLITINKSAGDVGNAQSEIENSSKALRKHLIDEISKTDDKNVSLTVPATEAILRIDLETTPEKQIVPSRDDTTPIEMYNSNRSTASQEHTDEKEPSDETSCLTDEEKEKLESEAAVVNKVDKQNIMTRNVNFLDMLMSKMSSASGSIVTTTAASSLSDQRYSGEDTKDDYYINTSANQTRTTAEKQDMKTPIKINSLLEQHIEHSNDSSDVFLGFDDEATERVPGMLHTPIVPQRRKSQVENVAFVSESLNEYMRENLLDTNNDNENDCDGGDDDAKKRIKLRKFRQAAHDGLVTPSCIAPPLDMPLVPESLQRLRTVAERRQYLQKCSRNHRLAIINNEASIYRELQRKKRHQKVKSMQPTQANTVSMPFTRRGWQAASFVSTEYNRYYYQMQDVDYGADVVKLPGVRGNNEERYKQPYISKPQNENMKRCHMDCIDATIWRDIKPIKTIVAKAKLNNSTPLPSVFRPCPLSQKPFQKPLDDETAAILLAGGSMAVVRMPTVELEVFPQLGKPLHEIAKRYLQHILPHHDITREWAEFSVSTLQQPHTIRDVEAVAVSAISAAAAADGLYNHHRRKSFTFAIPYLNDRNHILVRRVVDRCEKLDESFEKAVAYCADGDDDAANDSTAAALLMSDLSFREGIDADSSDVDGVLLECANVLTDIINCVAISCSENSFIKDDPDNFYDIGRGDVVDIGSNVGGVLDETTMTVVTLEDPMLVPLNVVATTSTVLTVDDVQSNCGGGGGGVSGATTKVEGIVEDNQEGNEQSTTKYIKDVQESKEVREAKEAKESKELKKTNRMLMELRRLNATIIDAGTKAEKKTKPCERPYCVMGCVCSSLTDELPLRQHCGKSKCIIECSCKGVVGQTHIMRLDTDVRWSKSTGHSITTEDAFMLRRQATARLARMEKEFTSTIVLTENETLLINESQYDKKRRCTKAPKRYEDFADTDDDFNTRTTPVKASKTPSLLAIEDTTSSSFAGLSESVTELREPIYVQESVLDQMKHCRIELTRFNDASNMATWCMVHELYKCYCGGRAIEGKPLLIETEEPPIDYKKTLYQAKGNTGVNFDMKTKMSSGAWEYSSYVLAPKARYSFEKVEIERDVTPAIQIPAATVPKTAAAPRSRRKSKVIVSDNDETENEQVSEISEDDAPESNSDADNGSEYEPSIKLPATNGPKKRGRGRPRLKPLQVDEPATVVVETPPPPSPAKKTSITPKMKSATAVISSDSESASTKIEVKPSTLTVLDVISNYYHAMPQQSRRCVCVPRKAYLCLNRRRRAEVLRRIAVEETSSTRLLLNEHILRSVYYHKHDIDRQKRGKDDDMSVTVSVDKKRKLDSDSHVTTPRKESESMPSQTKRGNVNKLPVEATLIRNDDDDNSRPSSSLSIGSHSTKKDDKLSALKSVNSTKSTIPQSLDKSAVIFDTPPASSSFSLNTNKPAKRQKLMSLSNTSADFVDLTDTLQDDGVMSQSSDDNSGIRMPRISGCFSMNAVACAAAAAAAADATGLSPSSISSDAIDKNPSTGVAGLEFNNLRIPSAAFREFYNAVIKNMNNLVSKKMQDIDNALKRESKVIPPPNEEILCIITWKNFLDAFLEGYIHIWEVKMRDYSFFASTITNLMPVIVGALGVINIKALPFAQLPLMGRMLMKECRTSKTQRLAVVMQGRAKHWLVRGFLRPESSLACAKPTPQSHPLLTKKINLLCSLMVQQRTKEYRRKQELSNQKQEQMLVQQQRLSQEQQCAANPAGIMTNGNGGNEVMSRGDRLNRHKQRSTMTPPATSKLPDSTVTCDGKYRSFALSTAAQSQSPTSTLTSSSSSCLLRGLNIQAYEHMKSNIEFRKVTPLDVDEIQPPHFKEGDQRWLVLDLRNDFSHIFVPDFRDLVSLDRIQKVMAFCRQRRKIVKLQFFKNAPFDAFVTPTSTRKIYFGPLDLNMRPPLLILLQSVDGQMMLREIYQQQHNIRCDSRDRRTTAFWILQIGGQIHFEIDSESVGEMCDEAVIDGDHIGIVRNPTIRDEFRNENGTQQEVDKLSQLTLGTEGQQHMRSGGDFEEYDINNEIASHVTKADDDDDCMIVEDATTKQHQQTQQSDTTHAPFTSFNTSENIITPLNEITSMSGLSFTIQTQKNTNQLQITPHCNDSDGDVNASVRMEQPSSLFQMPTAVVPDTRNIGQPVSSVPRPSSSVMLTLPRPSIVAPIVANTGINMPTTMAGGTPITLQGMLAAPVIIQPPSLAAIRPVIRPQGNSASVITNTMANPSVGSHVVVRPQKRSLTSVTVPSTLNVNSGITVSIGSLPPLTNVVSQRTGGILSNNANDFAKISSSTTTSTTTSSTISTAAAAPVKRRRMTVHPEGNGIFSQSAQSVGTSTSIATKASTNNVPSANTNNVPSANNSATTTKMGVSTIVGATTITKLNDESNIGAGGDLRKSAIAGPGFAKITVAKIPKHGNIDNANATQTTVAPMLFKTMVFNMNESDNNSEVTGSVIPTLSLVGNINKNGILAADTNNQSPQTLSPVSVKRNYPFVASNVQRAKLLKAKTCTDATSADSNKKTNNNTATEDVAQSPSANMIKIASVTSAGGSTVPTSASHSKLTNIKHLLNKSLPDSLSMNSSVRRASIPNSSLATTSTTATAMVAAIKTTNVSHPTTIATNTPKVTLPFLSNTSSVKPIIKVRSAIRPGDVQLRSPVESRKISSADKTQTTPPTTTKVMVRGKPKLVASPFATVSPTWKDSKNALTSPNINGTGNAAENGNRTSGNIPKLSTNNIPKHNKAIDQTGNQRKMQKECNPVYGYFCSDIPNMERYVAKRIGNIFYVKVPNAGIIELPHVQAVNTYLNKNRSKEGPHPSWKFMAQVRGWGVQQTGATSTPQLSRAEPQKNGSTAAVTGANKQISKTTRPNQSNIQGISTTKTSSPTLPMPSSLTASNKPVVVRKIVSMGSQQAGKIQMKSSSLSTAKPVSVASNNLYSESGAHGNDTILIED